MIVQINHTSSRIVDTQQHIPSDMEFRGTVYIRSLIPSVHACAQEQNWVAKLPTFFDTTIPPPSPHNNCVKDCESLLAGCLVV